MNLIFFLMMSFTCIDAEELSIIDKLSDQKGFEFNFVQKKYYKFLKEPKISNGHAIYSHSGNFIWETTGTNAGKIISNGKNVWIYTPAEEEGDVPVVHISQASKLKGVGSFVMSGQYKVSDLKESNKAGYKELKINGAKDKGYEWAKLSFDDRTDFRLDSIEFEDIDSSKVLIEIKDFKKLKSRLSPKLFTFKPPKGARIIR